MENENKSFVFYSSYYEALKQLDTNTRLQIYDAIMQFALENKEPTLTGVASAIFSLIRPTLTASINRYNKNVENGQKGGAPIGNQNARKQPKNNPNSTQKQPKNNLNDNENENYNYNDNSKEKEKEKKTLSLGEIQTFKDTFPNRKLDLDKLQDLIIPPNFDMPTLIQHIKQSTFLTTANNMGLFSCLKNYDCIINDNYANFTKPQDQAPTTKELWERQYPSTELNSLFDKLEDILV